MKISIDVDLSPQEARELMGWPDMSKIHEATISQLTEQIKSGNQELMLSMLKPYLDGSQQAFTYYQKMLESMATAGTSKK
ncbi:DUF6489 family protein [Alteromonas confluentis]|mgnify:CR=1 FL=1|uniref:Uncharacterized protein n=1 Tax=Alteromonas confluentis TaxID=1656094 RepID=A0A1E7Z8A3_9ALTE|nr:DUF6489 family protein [Alteromonas confluentis]OFC69671.1 hypothetical protein BFC18_16515 [Alteromonas confluentis]